MREVHEYGLRLEDETKLEKYISLAEKLSRYPEPIPFYGLESDSLAKLKADDEAHPGYTTPTENIIGRMKTEGFKVAFGKHPESGNVFILPFLSPIENIEVDMLFPYHLTITEEMDDTLKAFILASKARYDKSVENETSSDTDIKSMNVLAKKLGCKISENGGWYRVYSQKNGSISILRNGENIQLDGLITIISVDDKYPPKGEKIVVGVRVGGPSSVWERTYSLNKKDTDIPLNIPTNGLGSFDKSSLKNGGYSQIFEYISRIKDEGFFMDQLEMIEEQMRKGQEFVDDIVIPTARKAFPELVSSKDCFIKSRDIYFWEAPKKRSRANKGIRLNVLPGIIEVSIGRIRLLSSGEVDSKYFGQTEYTVAPPPETMLDGKVHSGWHFAEGDRVDARRVIEDTLIAIRKSDKY